MKRGRRIPEAGRAERERELVDFMASGVPIAGLLGLTLSFNEKGEAVISAAYDPAQENGYGATHGGILMTMLDAATWFSSAVTHESGTRIATSAMTVHFLRPVLGSGLKAVASLIKSGKRQDVAEAYIYDDSGQKVAHTVCTMTIIPGAV